MKRALGGGLIWLVMLVLLPAAAQAATLSVTTTADTGPGSLRAQIAAASAGDTVSVPASASHYTVNSEIPIRVPLTIQGAGARSTIIDGGGHTRIFHVSAGVSVFAAAAAAPSFGTTAIEGVTLTGGSTTSMPGGGAILVDSGALSITDASLTNNVATVSAGTTGKAGGGAIYNNSGNTTLTRATLAGDQATVTATTGQEDGGGALYENAAAGTVTVTDSNLSYNTTTVHGADTGASRDPCCNGGGAIYLNAGRGVVTTIAGSTLDGNTATVTGGECCHGGGAIYSDESGDSTKPTLVIASSHLDHNTTTVTTQVVGSACCSGGGVLASFSGIAAADTTFDYNTATLTNQECCNGGGALNFDGGNDPLSFVRTDISHNAVSLTTAADPKNTGSTCCNGGGAMQLDISSAVLTVTDSLISANTATMNGVTESGGGGVYDDTSSGFRANYNNSTLTGNITNVGPNGASPPQGGGFLYDYGVSGTTHSIDTFTNSTLAGNRAPSGSGGGVLTIAGDVHLTNTVVAGNDAAAASNCAADKATPTSSLGTFSSGGHNLEDANTCGLTGTGDQVSIPAKLGPLQNNGGPLSTMALLTGSPAINAADNAVCPAADMRGVSRPQPAGGTCDIGAYEAVGPTAATLPATAISDGGATLNGTVNPENLVTTVRFDYGPTAAYGNSTTAQTLGGGFGAMAQAAPIGQLAPLTTYHYRIVATNQLGTATSPDATFTTTATPTPRPSAGRLVPFGRVAFVSPGGVAGVFVGCVGNACTGGMTITAGGQTIASRKTYAVGGDDAAIVHVSLDAAARQALQAAARHHLAATVTVSDSGGHSASANETLIGFLTTPGANAARAGSAAFGRTGFVSSGGSAGLFVGCFGAKACTGTLALTGGHSTTSYHLSPGTGGLVFVPLSSSTRQALARHGRLSAHATLVDGSTRARQSLALTLVSYL